MLLKLRNKQALLAVKPFHAWPFQRFSMLMAGHYPNFIEEIYDEPMQLIEEQNGFVEAEDDEDVESGEDDEQMMDDQYDVVENENLDEDDEDAEFVEDDESYDDDESDDDDEGEDVEFTPVITSPRVSPTGPSMSSQEAEVNQGLGVITSEENEDNDRRTKGGDKSLCNGKLGKEENAGGGGLNRSEIDGLFCPICLEAWTSGGDHKVCCLPCGHIYGLSCIKRWLQHRRSSQKCPQCKKKCTLKDVRVLYASHIVVVEEELQKKVWSLEAKCAFLEKKMQSEMQAQMAQMKEELMADLRADMHAQIQAQIQAQMVQMQEQFKAQIQAQLDQHYSYMMGQMQEYATQIATKYPDVPIPAPFVPSQSQRLR